MVSERLNYDVTQPYVELDINIDLPPIEYLKYTSDGRMIVASESGYFYISDGITSAIDEIRNQQAAVVIYPNPTEDIIHISSEYDIQKVEVMDYNGRSIYVTYDDDTVDMSEWNSGFYLLRLTTDSSRIITKKIFKL